MAKRRIGIIGNGNVGSALQQGFAHAGHDVKTVGNDPAAVRKIADWAEVLVLAVPFSAVDAAVREMGDGVNGKVLIDVTNALTPDYKLALGFTTSAGEELQKKVPEAKVVKAFNTIFAQQMATGQVKGTKLSLFVAGDDAGARETVRALGREMGFDAIDAGPLRNARLLEPLGYFNIQLAYNLEMGRDIGFKLVH